MTDDDVLPNLIHCKVVVTCPDLSEGVVHTTVHCNELLSSLKVILVDFVETCAYSCYHFTYSIPTDQQSTESNIATIADFTTEILNEYQEIGQIILESLTKKYPSTKLSSSNELVELHLKIVNDSYDVKRARAQVKRVRDILYNPPKLVGSLEDAMASNDNKIPYPHLSSSSSDDYALPSLENIFPKSDDIKLSKFYDETLHRFSLSHSINVTQSESQSLKVGKNKHKNKSLTSSVTSVDLSSAVQSIVLSSFNPPPSNRLLQGDLLYVEIDTLEGKFYITAISKGFYVNRSTIDHFDPRPQMDKMFFANTLFQLLCQISESFKKKWSKYVMSKEKISFKSQDGGGTNKHINALESLSMDYLQNNSNRLELILPHQWNISHPDKAILTQYKKDSWRCTEDICNNFGMSDDKGPMREWNDEIQSLRDMTAPSLPEKLSKARLLFRTISEFVESCQHAVSGIADGYILPVNPMDNICNYIYIYNNIFFSQAVDNKETFKLCSGMAACHKVAGHDHKNQRKLQSLINDVRTVASVIIDYKGVRYVCQSVIPGILFSNGGAKLMYGVMEYNKRFTNKKSSWSIIEKISKAFYMSPRNQPLFPVPVSSAFVESISVTPDLDSSMTAEESPILIDVIDDIVSENDPAKQDKVIVTTPHVGPIESKLLKGTDGRVYALEMTRLTPRDANFVLRGSQDVSSSQTESGVIEKTESTQESASLEKFPYGCGTGLIQDTKLRLMDEDLASTCALRHELIEMYLQRKVYLKRAAIYHDAITQLKNEISTASASDSESATKLASTIAAVAKTEAMLEDLITSESDEDVNVAENIKQPDSADKTTENGNPKTVKGWDLQELQKRMHEVTHASDGISIDFSPNAFAKHPERSTYFTSAENCVNSSTNESLNMSPWINSDVDRDVVKKDEDVARDLSHFLFTEVLPSTTTDIRKGENVILGGEKLVQYLHGRGINLRYLGQLAELALVEEQEDLRVSIEGKQRFNMLSQYWLELLEMEMITRAARRVLTARFLAHKEAADAPAITIVSFLNYIFGYYGVDNTNGSHMNSNNSSSDQDYLFPPANALPDKMSFIQEVISTIKSRFLYAPTLVNYLKENEIIDDMPSRDIKLREKTCFLKERLSPLPMLRRVCMLCGIRIGTRDYDFRSAAPFRADDIIALVPRIKASTDIDSYHDIPIIKDAMNSVTVSQKLLQQNHYTLAFEKAYEAMQWLQDCTGPVHKHFRSAIQELSSICISAGDYEQALAFASRSLALSVQTDGLDSGDTLNIHVKLASIHQGMLGQMKNTLLDLAREIEDKVKKDTNSSVTPSSVKDTATNNIESTDPATSSDTEVMDLVKIERLLHNCDIKNLSENNKENIARIQQLQSAMNDCRRHISNHLLTAKYLAELIGGIKHPELSPILLSLGHFLASEGEFESALGCLMEAKARMTSLYQIAGASTLIAETFYNLNNFPKCIEEEKICFKLMSDLFGSSDSRTIESKRKLEFYFRSMGEFENKVKTTVHQIYNEKQQQKLINSTDNTKTSTSLPTPSSQVVNNDNIVDNVSIIDEDWMDSTGNSQKTNKKKNSQQANKKKNNKK